MFIEVDVSGITSKNESKPSSTASEITINSAIQMDDYESKYTRNVPSLNLTNIHRKVAKTYVVVDDNICMPNFIKLSRYEGKQKHIIPLDPNIHVSLHDTSGNLSCSKGPTLLSYRPNTSLEHCEKAYEVLGITESVYNVDEEEHKTVTTTQLTEYNLTDKTAYNINVDRMMKGLIIDEINHDRDHHIKPHFQDEPDPVHLHFCMRYSCLAFFWRLLSSWFTYIYGIVICI